MGTTLDDNITPGEPIMRPILQTLGYAFLAAIIGLVTWSGSRVRQPDRVQSSLPATQNSTIDLVFDQHWRDQQISPQPIIDDLTFARRASLGIVGVIPSLEEIRWYEAQAPQTRRADYVDKLLADRRFADTLAERLAAAWLPARVGDNFVLYRPYRFIAWLADQIDAHIPYPTIVQQMLASDGLWTTTPAVNFITAYAAKPEELAGQTARNFLGLQIGCAQCHDHPFASWKQKEFRGLAAQFGRTDITFRGIDDSADMFRFGAEGDSLGVLVPPQVPYGDNPNSTAPSPRHHLAQWVTQDSNERFAQAIVNRIWAMMFGRGIVQPVDDLDAKHAVPGALEAAAQVFHEHKGELRAVFRSIALSQPFQTSSTLDQDRPSASASNASAESLESSFASYPLTRLDPAQVAQSLLQVSSIRTIDRQTGVVRRVIGFFQRQDFLEFFATQADDESGTIAQRLMLMNDRMVQERIASDMGSTAERISTQATTPDEAVHLAFLICLTRRPNQAETASLAPMIPPREDRLDPSAIEDLLWALVNSSEFLLRH
jgi:hypothetical protein